MEFILIERLKYVYFFDCLFFFIHLYMFVWCTDWSCFGAWRPLKNRHCAFLENFVTWIQNQKSRNVALILPSACMNAAPLQSACVLFSSYSLITSKSVTWMLPLSVTLPMRTCKGRVLLGFVARLWLQDAWPCAAPSRRAFFFFFLNMGAGAI